MSIWTHVSGSIRLDAYNRDNVKDDVKNRKIIKRLLNNHIPSGSEGDLQYRIITNKSMNCLESYRIIVWADLRSHKDTKDIEYWYKQFIRNIKRYGSMDIRDSVIVAEVESRERIILNYKEQYPRWGIIKFVA